MTPATARLIRAAERVKAYLDADIQGKYFAPNEDICAGRELAEALIAIKEEHAVSEQFAAASRDPRRS